MKTVTLTCQNCGANLDVKDNIAFCCYCGAKLVLDDENRTFTYNYNYNKRDEARIRESELKEKIRLKELENQEKERERKHKEQKWFWIVWAIFMSAISFCGMVLVLLEG